ncbi:ion channel [Nocardioides dubius]|uniref:Potassium channel family protein n=1 Tax=Nocardioides dubius TaxID=317019 RepID=A0ABN1TTD5_9ACTN
MASDRLGLRHSWLAAGFNLVAVLVLYFALPVQSGQGAVRMLANLALTCIAVAAVAFVLFRETARTDVETSLSVLNLVLLLEIVLIAFSFIYFALASNNDQFDGIETRLDALYFTLTTTTTTGYGDVHPTGQTAKAVVSAHMAFNLVFIAAIGAALRRSFHGRRGDTTQDAS